MIQQLITEAGQPRISYDFINRLLNSEIPEEPSVYWSPGDIAPVEFSLSNSNDGNEDYELVCKHFGFQFKYLRFHTIAELQTKLLTNDWLIIDTAANFMPDGVTPNYAPGLKYIELKFIDGYYYAMGIGEHPTNGRGVYCIQKATTIAGIIANAAAATSLADHVFIVAGLSDFEFCENPFAPGFIGSGHDGFVANVVTTSGMPDTPNWTNHGRVFNPISGVTDVSAICPSMADESIFVVDGKLFIMVNGLHFLDFTLYPHGHMGNPTVTLPCVFEVGEDYKAIGLPQTFIRTLGKPAYSSVGSDYFHVSPTYIKIQGREEVWWTNNDASFNNGFCGVMTVGANDRGIIRNPRDLMRFVAGSPYDQSNNASLRVYGGAALTGFGLECNSEGQGLWGYINSISFWGNLSKEIRINCSQYNAEGSVLFFASGYPTNTFSIMLWIDSVGNLKLTTINQSSATTTQTIGHVTLNEAKRILLTKRGSIFSVDGVNYTFANWEPVNMVIYSLGNKGTDLLPTSMQFYGTIEYCRISRT